MDKNLDIIVEELSEKYGLSKFQVELIVKSQFGKVRDVVTDEEYKSIQLIHLGKFQISSKRVSNYLKEKEDE